MLAILAKPALRERMRQSGFQVVASDGKTHMDKVRREIAMYRDIIKQAGIKVKS